MRERYKTQEERRDEMRRNSEIAGYAVIAAIVLPILIAAVKILSNL